MKYALVVDLGATNLRIALVNDEHKILKKVKCLMDKSKDIAFTIYTEYKKMNLDLLIEGVAVGVAGSIDFKNNTIRDLPNLKIKEYDLYDALYKLFKVDIRIINDAVPLIPAMKNSSGQWWANSVTSKRSLVMRPII